MPNLQLVHHQSNFTTWSMLLLRHCQEIWSSTVIMLIILLKSLTRISQFMTLCWWFYFQIGLRILWSYFTIYVDDFAWVKCVRILWSCCTFLLMISLELSSRTLWSFCTIYIEEFSWVRPVPGFYDPIVCPFMLMIFLESGKNFMILLYDLCWWFCLRWVWGFYDLNAQFMLMVLLESSARILWSCCTIYVDDFASILWGFYNLVVKLMLMIFCLSLVRILWSRCVQLMLMILFESCTWNLWSCCMWIYVDDVCCSGIIPRSAAEIFEKADADREFEYHVSMSYIQIYMEQVRFNSLSIRFQTRVWFHYVNRFQFRPSRLNFLVHHQIELEKQNLLGCGNRLNFKLDMSKFANGSRNILWLQIQDLLRPESCNMQIREGDNGVFVSGVKDVGSNYLLYYAPSPPNLQQHFFLKNCAI